MSNEWRWVIAAYAITWLAVIGYAAHVELRWRRARRANAEGR